MHAPDIGSALGPLPPRSDARRGRNRGCFSCQGHPAEPSGGREGRAGRPARRAGRGSGFATKRSTLSRLSHPNIASVFEFGSHADIDYLVMEYVPGTTLNALLHSGPLESAAVARLGAQLARGLAAAHDVRHRPPRHQAGERPGHAGRPAEDPGLRHGDVRAAGAEGQDDDRVLRPHSRAGRNDPVHGAGAPARHTRPIRGPTSSAPGRFSTSWRAGGRRSAIRSPSGSSSRS